MQVKAAQGFPIARLERVIIHASRQRAKEGVKAAVRWETVFTVEAQVPFSHHVGGVTDFLETLR